MSERTSGHIRGRVTAPTTSAEETHRQIDSIYDQAETFVTGIGRIMGVDTRTCEARAPRLDQTIEYRKPAILLPAAPTRSFEIVEVTTYVVTNGRDRLALPTREQAEAVLARLREVGQ